MKQEPLRFGFIAIILVAFMSAWAVVSGSQNGGPGSIVPKVTATNPADNAIGVAVNQPVAVTFSQQMSAPSLTDCLIVRKPNGVAVSGTIALYNRTAIFRPLVDLAPHTTYTVRIRPEVSDLAGIAMGVAYKWSFTTGAASDTTAPTVTSTDPADLQMSVPTNQRIIATFSEDMAPASINTTNFKVTKPGGVAIAGAVHYVSGTAIFVPTYGLKINTQYTATITTGAKDLARNPLAADYVWSFTTGASPDTVDPTVTSTIPADGATDVPLDQTVSATFSEVMNYATITTGNFLLTWSGGSVVGTVTYVYDSINNVTQATFVPQANLLNNTLYTATITTEAQDLAGNPLAADKVWQFTTGASSDLSPVPLGAAASFAVLAAAGVSNTSTPTTITGDVGIWPGTSMTNFPPGIVTGAVHVNDTTAQAAEAALGIAYGNAAGRVGPFTPADGNVGGLTFTPGLYRSGTSTEISGGGNLTLDAGGDPNAVFIFQIASTLTTSSGFGITLAGGAKPSQIFWEVGSSATIGVGSQFVGTILANTSITLVSGATLNGRALAGAVSGTGAVTMDDNTVVLATP